MCLPKNVQKFKRNWNNSGRIKVDNFLESVSFQASQQSALIKKLKLQNPEFIEYSFLCEKPTFSAKHILIYIF